MRTALRERERQGAAHFCQISQDRKHVLFAVGIAIGCSGKSAHYGLHMRRHVAGESECGGGIYPDFYRLPALGERTHRGGIEDFHRHCCRQGIACEIAERNGQGGAVAAAEEARHVRLQHKLFAGHDGRIQKPVVHGLRMRQQFEPPTGERFGKREHEVHVPKTVCAELRLEEGSFCKVLAHLTFVCSVSIYAFHIIFRVFIGCNEFIRHIH